MKVPPLTSDRKKILILKGLGVALVVFLVILFFMSSGSKKTNQDSGVYKVDSTRIKLPTEGVDIAEKQWVLQADTIIRSMRRTIKQNEEAINELKQRADYLEEKLRNIETNLGDITSQINLLNKNIQNAIYNKPGSTGPLNVDSLYNSPLPPFTPQNKIKIFKPDYSQPDTLNFFGNSSLYKDSTQDSLYAVIPSGSFVRGRILAGVNAPTGGSEPYPVLIEITDQINAPSFHHKKIDSAFIIGSALGDLVSERANIRLEKLAFYYTDGTVFDEPVKGWVVDGNDGEYGVRGKLVSKEGRFIGMSLLAGFAGGLSEAIEAAGKVTTVTPIGSITSTIASQKIAQVATASGISKAAEMMAEFYIEKAKKLFPVIEIRPGTPVDIVFMDGIKLKKEVAHSDQGFLGVD